MPRRYGTQTTHEATRPFQARAGSEQPASRPHQPVIVASPQPPATDARTHADTTKPPRGGKRRGSSGGNLSPFSRKARE